MTMGGVRMGGTRVWLVGMRPHEHALRASGSGLARMGVMRLTVAPHGRG